MPIVKNRPNRRTQNHLKEAESISENGNQNRRLLLFFITHLVHTGEKKPKLFTIIREKCLQINSIKNKNKIFMTQQCHHASECCFLVYHF